MVTCVVFPQYVTHQTKTSSGVINRAINLQEAVIRNQLSVSNIFSFQKFRIIEFSKKNVLHPFNWKRLQAYNVPRLAEAL